MFLCVIMKHNYAIKAEMETTMEIQMWKEILTPYDLAVEELQIKFNHIIKEYRQAGVYSPIEQDRKSTRLNSSHYQQSRMPSSA